MPTRPADPSDHPSTQANGQPWYEDGLRFGCTRCGNCCTGAPGCVWVTSDEIARIAAYRGEAPDGSAKHFVRQVGQRQSLTEEPNGDCVFYDRAGRGCSIYPVRPRQCRTWPFWGSNLRSPETWRATCQVCPGSGKGEFVPLEEIERRAALMHI